MKNYRVYIIRTYKGKEKEFCFTTRGTSEEDVYEYLEKEFIPDMAKGRTSLCLSLPGAVYKIDKISIPMEQK